MMLKISFVCLIVGIAVLECAGEFPSYLERCKKDDPKFDECLLAKAQAGLPHIVKGDKKLGIISYAPVDFPPKTPIATGDLELSLSNLKILGVDSTTVAEIKWDVKEQHLYLLYKYPKIVWDFDYEGNGKFLDQEFKGKGHGTKTYENGWFTYEIQYEGNTVDGVVYPKIKGGKSTYGTEKITYAFDNLSNGEEMNKFINKNWSKFDGVLHAHVSELIFSLGSFSFSGIFNATPLDQLFE